MTQPVQAIVPDTKRYRSPEAETASVYPTRDHDYHDLVMCMLRSALEESQEDDPHDLVMCMLCSTLEESREDDPHDSIVA